jgi:hypothetical protein
MEFVAFLAYNDARWMFGLRVKPILLGLAIAFQTGMLLCAVWSYSVGLELWWCALQMLASFHVLYLLLVMGDDKLWSLSKQVTASYWAYVALCLISAKSSLLSDPFFTSTLAAFKLTYHTVYCLFAAIVVMGLLIKIAWLVLSLAKPRLHLRLHGYRDN